MRHQPGNCNARFWAGIAFGHPILFSGWAVSAVWLKDGGSWAKENPRPLARTGVLVRRLAVPYFRTGLRTIIGAKRFHFRGRDGIGWCPLALATRQTGLKEPSADGVLPFFNWKTYTVAACHPRPTPFGCYMVKPHGPLVRVSCMHYCTSTPRLSTS